MISRLHRARFSRDFAVNEKSAMSKRKIELNSTERYRPVENVT